MASCLNVSSWWLLTLLFFLFCSSFEYLPLVKADATCRTKKEKNNTEESDFDEMLTGYKILHHTLGKEAQLQYLHWLRDATFRWPTGEFKRLFTQIHQLSKDRRKELESLFEMEPKISLAEAPKSKIGDAIQGAAEWSGTVELISPLYEKTFDIRFVFLQAQATRMISAIASSIQDLEQNPKRALWLLETAKEYEDIREQLIRAMEGCRVVGVDK